MRNRAISSKNMVLVFAVGTTWGWGCGYGSRRLRGILCPHREPLQVAWRICKREPARIHDSLKLDI